MTFRKPEGASASGSFRLFYGLDWWFGLGFEPLSLVHQSKAPIRGKLNLGYRDSHFALHCLWSTRHGAGQANGGFF